MASFADLLGRTFGSYYELVSKKNFLLSSIIRGIVCIAMCLLTYLDVYPVIFRADWFMVLSLFMFAGTFGYWTAIGMRYGSD